jgi:hypothetical protein
VTSSGASGIDKGSSAADEGVVTGSSDNDESLTTLDSRRSIALVTLVLVYSERLAGDGRLVDLEESIIGHDTAVGGNDGTLLNLEDVTGDDLRGLDLLESTVTENNSLESEGPAKRLVGLACETMQEWRLTS